MAQPATLSDTISQKFESAVAANPGLDTSSGELPPGVGPAPSQNGQATTPPADAQPTPTSDTKPDAKPDIAELGFEGVQPPEPKGEMEAPGSAKLELDIAPETIVGKLNGEPVTGAQLVNAVAAHADVTRTRTEYAEYKKNADPAIAFIQANMEPLQILSEASEFAEKGDAKGAEAALTRAFESVAKQIGIEFKARTGPERDSATGRFQASSERDLEKRLGDIAEEFGEDSREYQTEVRLQEQDKRLAEHEKFRQSLEERGKSAQAAAQAKAEVSAWGEKWTAKGIEGVNVDAAAALVGKPISAAQAMQLANLQPFLSWYVKSGAPGTASRPNEPGGGGATPPMDLTGKSTKDILEAKYNTIGRR